MDPGGGLTLLSNTAMTDLCTGIAETVGYGNQAKSRLVVDCGPALHQPPGVPRQQICPVNTRWSVLHELIN